MHRREFLGGSLAFVSLSGGMPALLVQAAERAAGAEDRTLVVVELSGGNDGLNTLIPFEDPLYYRNRRKLAIPKKEVLRIDDRLGFHPRMKAMAELYREGRVAVVQGVGYPQPDRSHFRSMEIWHTASVEPKPPSAGWLGRFLDGVAQPEGAFPRGVSLTETLPQALQADRAAVPVAGPLGEGEDPASAALLRRLSTAPAEGEGPVAFLRRQAETHYRTADRLKEAAANSGSTVAYPEGELGGQLRRAAQILAAGLGVRILYVAQDGYDTHAAQADTHGGLLETLSNALAAFQRDLATANRADRVLVLVFSEFGRRVDENASGGTDHGAASCLFLVGPKVKGGLAGRYPRLDRLGDGDLVFNTDFRSVYATVLERWLGCPAEPLLGGSFPKLDVLA